MGLFYFIPFVAFLQTYQTEILNVLLSTFFKATSTDADNCAKQLKIMKNKLSKISMTEEWAKYAKLQRLIMVEKVKFQKLQESHASEIGKLRRTTSFALQALFAFTLMSMAFWHRNEVIVTIPPKYLYPISTMICWSSRVIGGVTAPAWIVLSSATAKSLSALFSN